MCSMCSRKARIRRQHRGVRRPADRGARALDAPRRPARRAPPAPSCTGCCSTNAPSRIGETLSRCPGADDAELARRHDRAASRRSPASRTSRATGPGDDRREPSDRHRRRHRAVRRALAQRSGRTSSSSPTPTRCACCRSWRTCSRRSSGGPRSARTGRTARRWPIPHQAFGEGRMAVIFPSGRLAKRRWWSAARAARGWPRRRCWRASSTCRSSRSTSPRATRRCSTCFDRIHPTLRDITLVPRDAEQGAPAVPHLDRGADRRGDAALGHGRRRSRCCAPGRWSSAASGRRRC